MSTRRWAYVVAAIEAACGVGAAAYFVVLGLAAQGPDRTAVDRAFPFLLASLALGVLGTMAWRSLRRARSLPDDRGGISHIGRQRGRQAGAPRVPPPAPERPELSAQGRAELERVVRVLGDAGVLGPRVPRLEDLVEGVADAGEPVTAGSVLGAVAEAEFWHPGFRAEDHLANLAFHDGHVEQFADTLRGQVDDLARLVGDALTVRLEHVEVTDDGRHRLCLRLGDAVEDLDYPGHPTYLSTVLHVVVARAARTAGTRIASLWVDQGVWLTVPRAGLVELNRDAPDHERWSWVDEEEPVAAGAP